MRFLRVRSFFKKGGKMVKNIPWYLALTLCAFIDPDWFKPHPLGCGCEYCGGCG